MSSKQGEVTVLCLGDTATIPDLGLHLGRGESQSISFSASQGSRDLRAARDQGLVALKVMRAMAFRPGEEPQVVRPPSRQGDNVTTVSRSAATAVTPPSAPTPQGPHQSLDLTSTVGLLQLILLELQGLRSDLARGQDYDPQGHRPLREARPQGPLKSGVPEEIYIPGTRLDEFTNAGRVSVEVTEGGHSTSLEDAVSALKARKKGIVE